MAGQYRSAAPHRLNRRQAKSFVKRGEHVEIRPGIPTAEFGIGHKPGEPHPVTEVQFIERRFQCAGEPAFRTHQYQLVIDIILYLRERAQQSWQVLARLQRADGEDVWLIDIPFHFKNVETLSLNMLNLVADSQGNRLHTVLRNTEPLLQVVGRGLGDRDDFACAPGAHPYSSDQPGPPTSRELIRVLQERKVVNGNHIRRGAEQWNGPNWRMEYIQPPHGDIYREPGLLPEYPGHGIILYRPGFLTEQEQIIVCAFDTLQPADQFADIATDSRLPIPLTRAGKRCVDTNSHSLPNLDSSCASHDILMPANRYLREPALMLLYFTLIRRVRVHVDRQRRAATGVYVSISDQHYSQSDYDYIDHDDDDAIRYVVEQFNAMYPFPLDTFQRDAIATFLRGDSVMVAAPTGSGKTVVAEFGIWEAFKRTGRVIYTAPIKALSNQKFRDLRSVYGDEVGLLTGDVTENRDARIIVMTTEILRNMLLQSPWELDDVETVIFDEIHYLADPERGTTWEESIILCPEHIQLICLSATVTNALEIAGWIGRTHRPIRLIEHFSRPVPLALYYYHENELAMVIDHHGEQVRDFGKVGGEARRRPGGRRRSDYMREAIEEPQVHEIVESLQSQELLPAIYFLFSRNDCQVFAERLAMMRPGLVKPGQQEQIEAILQTYLTNMRPEDQELEQVQLITDLARQGIGFHHAGLLPILKQLVEVLFGRGLMQVVFATDTLALGVNMPARSVVVGRMSKWDGRRRRILTPNEFQQMSGRAGRRGMDLFGHVVIPYSPIIPFKEALEVATGDLHPVQSAFAIRYNTVLNLWDPPRGERVRQMLQRSLAQYQTSQRIRLIENDILEIEAELTGLMAGRKDEITRADELLDEWQSLNRTVNGLQRQEQDLLTTIVSLRSEVSSSTPWKEPGRLALRKLLRSAKPGLVLHTRDHGWAIWLGRASGNGIGYVLRQNDRSVAIIEEYRRFDYVENNAHVEVPESWQGITEEMIPQLEEDSESIDAMLESLEEFYLPDLDEMAAAHRQLLREEADEEIAKLNTQLEDIRQQLESINARRAEHPFRDNKARKAHQRSVKRRDKLEREKETLTEILEREADAEDLRIRGIIRGIRDVLHRFGYLQRGYPTEKADMLADVFDTDGLILCEMIDQGMLTPLSAAELAEVCSWFSFDRDFRYNNAFTLATRLVNLRRKLEDLEHEILGEERDHRLFISEGHNPSFYGPAFHWCRGWSMSQIGEAIELSEGDLVMTFNKTIDLMRQLREMLINVEPEHPLVDKFREAEKLVRRGIVEQSLSLGFTPIADDDSSDDEEPEADDEVEL